MQSVEMNKIKISILLLGAVIFTKNIHAQSGFADSLFNNKQWKEAAKAYEAYFEKNPKQKPGVQWNKIAQCYMNSEMYTQAIDAYKKSVAYSGSALVMYNVACLYNAKLAQKDSALIWLDKAISSGYTQVQSTIDDEDLKSLKEDATFKELIVKMKKSFSPCSFQSETQQFNFWIGEWKVYNLQGQQSGSSKIEQILNDCVILENWTDYYGNKGKSFNFYNATNKYWQQTWVDDKGNVTEFINGKYEENAMRFHSSRPVLNGDKTGIRKLTFFNLHDNEVRQLGEISYDDGKSWITEYDLKYIRAQ